MSLTYDCNCRCPDPELVEVPGVEGDAGVAGINAYGDVSAPFTVPAIGGTVNITVHDDWEWIVAGANIFIVTAGYFSVETPTIGGTFLGKYLDVSGNNYATNVISAGMKVGPAGSLTNSGGFAGAVDPEGVQRASPGATYINTADESFWVKKTGTNTTTGWIEITGP